jgi:hypothetical protein
VSRVRESELASSEIYEEYDGRYMRKTPHDDPPKMKDVLYKVSNDPVYALSVVTQADLRHLMHVSIVSSEVTDHLEEDIMDDPNSVFEDAQYTYIVDFTARQLMFNDSEEDEWYSVPL